MTTKKDFKEKYSPLNLLGHCTSAPFVLKKRRELSHPGSYKRTFSLIFDVPEVDLQAEKIMATQSRESATSPLTDKLLSEPRSGDTVMLHVPNPKEMVDAVLKAGKFDENAGVIVRAPREAEPITNLHIQGEMSLREALTHAVRLVPVSMSLVELFAKKLSIEGHEHAKVFEGAKENPLVFGELQSNYEVAHLLERFPGRITAQELLDAQPRLGRRTFTISNVSKGCVGITVACVTAKAHQKLFGENVSLVRKGPTSHALSEVPEGVELVGHLKRYPFSSRGACEKDSAFFIAPGSAVGSVMGFLSDRQQMKSKGHFHIITGGQRFPDNFLYQEELNDYMKDGVLSSVHFAASRETGDSRIEDGVMVYSGMYLDQILWNNRVDFWQQIQGGAKVYICGMEDMFLRVKDILIQIAVHEGSLTKEEAETWLNEKFDSLAFESLTSAVNVRGEQRE